MVLLIAFPFFLHFLSIITTVDSTNLESRWFKMNASLGKNYKADLHNALVLPLDKSITILESADLGFGEQLLLCQSDNIKFFAAVKMMNYKYMFMAIGYTITAHLGSEEEIHYFIKGRAENYSRTVNSFKEFWKPASTFCETYGFYSHTREKNLCYLENQKTIQRNPGFTLLYFWFLDTEKFLKMLGVYIGSTGNAALGLFWANKKQSKFIIMNSLFEVYEAIPNQVHSFFENLFYYAKWTQDHNKLETKLDEVKMLKEVRKAATWIPAKLKLSLYAVHESFNYLGTIYQIQEISSPNAFIFIAWNIVNNYFRQYQFLHAGHIGTVRNAETWFINLTLRLKYFRTLDLTQKNSVAWFGTEGPMFEDGKKKKMLDVVSTHLQLPDKYKSKLTISLEKVSLMPQNPKESQQHSSHEHICLIIKKAYTFRTYTEAAFGYIFVKPALFSNGTDQIANQNQPVQYYPTETDAMDGAEYSISREYNIPNNLEWATNFGTAGKEETWRKAIIASQFLPPDFKAEHISVSEYWTSHSELLIVKYFKDNSANIEVSADQVKEEVITANDIRPYDVNGNVEAGIFFVSLNSLGNVTWVGVRYLLTSEIESWALAHLQAKIGAKEYTFQSFAFEEVWVPGSEKGILKEWSLSPTEKILLRSQGGYCWYEILVGNPLIPVQTGDKKIGIEEVLSDLKPQLEFRFPQRSLKNTGDTENSP